MSCAKVSLTSGLTLLFRNVGMMPVLTWGFFWEWRSSAWSSQCLATRNSSLRWGEWWRQPLLPLPGCRMLCTECPWQLWQAPCWRVLSQFCGRTYLPQSSARHLITTVGEWYGQEGRTCLKLICFSFQHPNWTFTHLQAFHVNFSVLSCYDHYLNCQETRALKAVPWKSLGSRKIFSYLIGSLFINMCALMLLML